MSKSIRFIDNPPVFKHNVIRRIMQVAATLILITLLLFISAGSVSWFYAWLYFAVCILSTIIGSFVLPLELVAERGSKKTNIEKWDKVLGFFLTLSTLGLYIICGLDFRWKLTYQITTELHIASIIIFALGYALVIWSMRANAYFSTAVRIQFDRGQTVCSGGPYKYIRHPGYLGMILYNLATPLFLGSLWAMIPASIVIIIFAIRTGLEDKMLAEKLPGYKQYTGQTKYRLFPGIWMV